MSRVYSVFIVIIEEIRGAIAQQLLAATARQALHLASQRSTSLTACHPETYFITDILAISTQKADITLQKNVRILLSLSTAIALAL
jgi:hypothetical protein